MCLAVASDMSGTPRQGARQTCLTAHNGPQQTAPTIKSTSPFAQLLNCHPPHIVVFPKMATAAARDKLVLYYVPACGAADAIRLLLALEPRAEVHYNTVEGGRHKRWLATTCTPTPPNRTRAGEPRGDVPAACRAWLAPAALQQGQRQRRGCAARAHPRGMERWWWRERGRRANPGGAARRRRGALPGPQAGHAGRVGGRRSRGAYAPHR